MRIQVYTVDANIRGVTCVVAIAWKLNPDVNIRRSIPAFRVAGAAVREKRLHQRTISGAFDQSLDRIDEAVSLGKARQLRECRLVEFEGMLRLQVQRDEATDRLQGFYSIFGLRHSECAAAHHSHQKMGGITRCHLCCASTTSPPRA